VKPAPFEYHAPSTVPDAVQLLDERGDDAKVLAGGQSLVPMLHMRLARFEALVDLRRVGELREIAPETGAVRVGAMVRQCDIEFDEVIRRDVPLLALATPLIGHFQIRSCGTVGGSIAHADPAAEYPAVALALDAELEAVGPRGRRTLPASEFFTGVWSTALESNEVLVAIRFPSWGPQAGFAIEEAARRHGDFAIGGAAVAVRVVDGEIVQSAIAMFGMGATPVRALTAEAALVGRPAHSVPAEEVGELAVDGLTPPDDLHASTELRRRIGRAMVARALRRALEEAQI
jgi:carbon-monoxide dehydrogenase medium subunit